MATPTQTQTQMPVLNADIVLPQVSQQQKQTYLTKSNTVDPKVANRIFWSYVLIVLLIVLHFAVPMELQQKYHLDVVYKSLGVISLAYIAYLSIYSNVC